MKIENLITYLKTLPPQTEVKTLEAYSSGHYINEWIDLDADAMEFHSAYKEVPAVLYIGTLDG